MEMLPVQMQTPRLFLLTLTQEVVLARLPGAVFELPLDTPDGPMDVVFPSDWPGEGLVILQLLAAAPAPPDDRHSGQYIAVERATGSAVGLLGVKGAPTDAGSVEIGYGINAARRREGLATEAVGALCHQLLATDGIGLVTAETAVANLASQAVLRRIGFREAGSDWSPDDGPLLRWELP